MNGVITVCLCLSTLTFSVGIADKMEMEVLDTDVSDNSFPPWTMVHSKNITCGPITPGLKFPAQTWTCADAKVDGQRLAYGLYPDISVDPKCMSTHGLDELAEVCLAMMRAMDVFKPLWAAFITEATCDYHNSPRRYLNRTKSETSEDEVSYSWVNLNAGNGWVHTFKCMAYKSAT